MDAALEPAQPFTTLKRGSRGEAVSDMQQPLYDLGYYDYYIDGIFGWRTERAIRLLQSDLGLKVTGVADADLQKQILSGTLEKYDPYRALIAAIAACASRRCSSVCAISAISRTRRTASSVPVRSRRFSCSSRRTASPSAKARRGKL